jgi:hypothetical protein
MNDEIIDVQGVTTTDVAPLGDETLLQLADQAEKRIDAITKIKRISLKSTNRHDWVDQGGKPYLQVSGAEKIARMFGISWRISDPVCETAEGGHYAYTYKGYFSLAGATIEAIGTRSSKDGFFKKYGYENGTKTELPASEIDRGDVKKSAYTNCIGNGITRLLGIRNLTYEDLQEFAGLTPDMMGRVDYKKKGKTDTGIQEEGTRKATSTVTEVRRQSGKTKAGKEYTKYIVKTPAGDYTTFSESNAKIAKEAMDQKSAVEIHFAETQYGMDLKTIAPAAPGESDDPPWKEGEE